VAFFRQLSRNAEKVISSRQSPSRSAEGPTLASSWLPTLVSTSPSQAEMATSLCGVVRRRQ
jgi:hypothetical protein